jgi:cytochrome oxidase Cu insertion factor (SCO1/SenC/PrrC family)
MSEKTKIVMVYASVVLVAVLVIGTSMWIRSSRKEAFQAVGAERPEVLMTLGKDLTATNQEGRQVSLSELKGKVWLALEFFASCPQCAKRNYTDLLKLYAEFKDDPNFHMVCISIDPETDGVEELQAYAEALEADSANWWFLTGPKDELHSYLRNEMKFLDVRERVDPEAIALEGRYAHDLGLELYRPGWEMVDKTDLAWAAQESAEMHARLYGELRAKIAKELEKIR